MKNTCGDCNHFVRYEGEDNGACYLNPPTRFQSGAQTRPTVKFYEKTCGSFAARPEEVVAEVKSKGQPVQPMRRK